MTKPSQKEVFRDITAEDVTKGTKIFRRKSILSPVTFSTQYTSLVSQVTYKVSAQELPQDKRLKKISAMKVTVLFLIVLCWISVQIPHLQHKYFSHWHESPGCRFSLHFENRQYFSPGIVSIRTEGASEFTLNQLWPQWKIYVWCLTRNVRFQWKVHESGEYKSNISL